MHEESIIRIFLLELSHNFNIENVDHIALLCLNEKIITLIENLCVFLKNIVSTSKRAIPNEFDFKLLVSSLNIDVTKYEPLSSKNYKYYSNSYYNTFVQAKICDFVGLPSYPSIFCFKRIPVFLILI